MVKFDPILFQKIGVIAVEIATFCSDRCTAKLNSPKDFEIGQGICTSAQQLNIDLVNASDTLSTALKGLMTEYPSLVDELNQPLKVLHSLS